MKNIASADYASIRALAEEADAWIERNSKGNGKGAEAVAGIADKAEVRLLNLANAARAAEGVSSRPTTIGVFGASQVGKSFLVNGLASDGGKLTTDWGGKEISFINLVNPTGGDHEATGVATRFTHAPSSALEAGGKTFPVELTVMRPAEIAMILCNGFFGDMSFTAEDKKELNSSLYTQEALMASVDAASGNEDWLLPEGGAPIIDRADAALLASYVSVVSSSFDLGKQEVGGPYWTAVRRLAPRLNQAGLEALLSPLWGRLDACTLMFRKVVGEMVKLCGARKVYAGLDAFVENEDAPEGKMKQKKLTVNSIDTVSSLFKGAGDSIKVAFEKQDGSAAVADIDFACMGAITLELLFPLKEHGGAGDFDVLDFPGARTRDENKYDDFVKDAELSKGGVTSYITDHGPELLRRGKVDYIFSRYTQDRAVDVLMLCLNISAQTEVSSLTTIVDNWISLNIGASSAERAKATRSPFLCVLTRSDEAVGKDIGRAQGTPSAAPTLISKAFEKLGQSSWINDWNGRPFSQIFMARSPGWAKGLIVTNTETREEYGIEQGKAASGKSIEDAIGECRASMATDRLASQVYGGVEHAFDAMMKLNDGGISEIKAFISKSFTGYNESRTRLDALVQGKARDALTFISPFAGSGSGTRRDAALEKARFIARGLAQCDETACIQGCIRTLLELDDGDLRERYLRDYTEYKNAPRFAQACMDVLKEKLSGLCSGPGFDALFSMVDGAWTGGASNFTRFDDARERYSFFYDQVKDRFIKSGAELRERFATLMQDLSQALGESAFSMDLQSHLEKALEENETLGGRQDFMASIQVRTAQQMISGFLCFLGFDLPDRPRMSIERRSEIIPGADDSRPLFAEKVELAEEAQNEGSPVRTLPLVPDELMASSGRHYLEDFLWALSSLMCGRNLQAVSPYRFSEDSQNEIDRILSGFSKFLALKAG